VPEYKFRFVTEPEKLLEICGPADITVQNTGAIVNAANSSLVGGGGVDGAIHRAGGPAILDECRAYVAKQGKLAAGKAMLTGGGNLAARFVIHTVGPVYSGGDHREHKLLASCYRESIRLADEHGICSLAFPAISTGAYGYPLQEAAEIAIASTVEALAQAKRIELVRFVLFDSYAVKAHASKAKQLLANRPEFLLEGE
jgi:O-acetyl-ADP-ribose deacetylase